MKTKARESYRYSNSILGFGWYTDTRDKKEELKKEILPIKNTTAQVISFWDSYFKWYQGNTDMNLNDILNDKVSETRADAVIIYKISYSDFK